MFEAARAAFCEAGFDQVGVRGIAARAATDPAIVIRLFGSKEALFKEVADGAFGLEPAFEEARGRMGEAVASLLLGSHGSAPEAGAFDAFRFLLLSAASPAAAPILHASLHAGFVIPLADRLGGEREMRRAALVTACILGFATMRFALASPALEPDESGGLQRSLAGIIQACIDG